MGLFEFHRRARRRYPGFRLEMEAEATDLFEESGRVTGIRAETPRRPLDVRADLVVGADGSIESARTGWQPSAERSPVSSLTSAIASANSATGPTSSY